jgi:MFS family permease
LGLAPCTDVPSALQQYKWQVVAMLWCVSFFNYADRAALFAMFPLLEREMHLSTVQLGLLGSGFAWMYGICAPFSGAIVDRVRRKRAVLAGLCAWSFIACCTSIARGFVQLLAFTTAEGVGESFYYPASMSMISDYHSPVTRSRAMGLHQTSVYVGTVGGAFLAGLIGQRFGWRWSFVTFGLFGIVLGLLLTRALREPERQQSDVTARQSKPSLVDFFRTLARSPAALLLLFGFCCANFVAMVLLSWMPKYLYDRFGLSVALAGLSATVFVQLASLCGSPLGGWLADYLQAKRSGGRIAVQAAALFCGAPFVFLCSRADSVTLIACALAIWGLFKGIYDANIFAALYDVIPAASRGAGAGVMNMVGWLVGGGLAPVTIGFLAQRIGLALSLGLTAAVYVVGGSVLLFASRLSYSQNQAAIRQQVVPVR